MKKVAKALVLLLFVVLLVIGWLFDRSVLQWGVGALVFAVIVFSGLGRLLRKGRAWLKVVVIGGALAAVVVFWITKAESEAGEPVSYSPKSAAYVRSAGDFPTEAEEDRWQFEEKYFQYMEQAERAEDCGIFLAEAEEILRTLRRRATVDVAPDGLSAAVEDLKEKVKAQGSLERIREKARRLEAFLDDQRGQILATLPAEMRDFRRNFEIQLQQHSLSDLTDDMEDVESELRRALAAMTRVATTEDTSLSAKLLERATGAVWVLEEKVSLSVLDEVRLTEIDASQLVQEAEMRGLTHTLCRQYGEQEAKCGFEDGRIRVNPNARQVTVVSRVEAPATVSLTSTDRPIEMAYVLFRWPSPFPARLGLVVDLTEIGLLADHSHALTLDRDQKISELRIPKFSYFTAGYPFARSTSETDDVLRPEEDDLAPRYFRTHNHVWIDLLPQGWVYRNAVVQRYKALLFSQNLMLALFAALTASVLAALVDPKKD